MNSKRLTAVHLRRVAEALELPTAGATDQLRQQIEGKLESEKHIEATNVQVIIQEEQYVEVKVALMDESGVFLETQTLTHSQKESESEIEMALAEAN